MSTPLPPAAPTPDAPAPASPAVIRRLDGVAETAHERLVRKHLPAWVVSGAVHVVVILLAILIFGMKDTTAAASKEIVTASTEPTKEADPPTNFEEERGLDANVEASVDVSRKEDKNVEAKVNDDPIGVANTTDAAESALALAGITDNPTAPGMEGTTGLVMAGGGGARGMNTAAFPGRSGARKADLLMSGGGSAESEAAVARGLAWLARQQLGNGSWVYDGRAKDQHAASTGMALLPFLAAGNTHLQGKYKVKVDLGVKFLVNGMMKTGGNAGKFDGVANMYAQGIAATAICEAYGMTKDRALQAPAQMAVNYIVKAQAGDGSWGYQPNMNGDTSIVGWQIQALKAGQLAGLTVPDGTLKRAVEFLDKISATTSKHSTYGYRLPLEAGEAQPGTARTAIGLLCRYYIDRWTPLTNGMAEGVDGLLLHGPKVTANGGRAQFDMYYYYYATQVVHFFDGPQWQDWNLGKMKDGKRQNGMRDWLIELQVKAGNDGGSWVPDDHWIGKDCGRLGTTCMSLLTLEVYYRHLPLFKRDTGGQKLLDAVGVK